MKNQEQKPAGLFFSSLAWAAFKLKIDKWQVFIF